jgi:microcystin-dependent protein
MPVLRYWDETDQEYKPVAAGFLASGGGNGAPGALVGELKMWSVPNPPAGWLVCDGAAISRANYSELFSVIATLYGAGDGSTTFNVPDLTGRVPMGASAARPHASTGGAETVSLTAAEQNAPHWHTIPDPTHAHGGIFGQGGEWPVIRWDWSVYGYLHQDNIHDHWSTAAAQQVQVSDRVTATSGLVSDARYTGIPHADWSGNGWGHENMQPYLAISYIIYAGV